MMMIRRWWVGFPCTTSPTVSSPLQTDSMSTLSGYHCHLHCHYYHHHHHHHHHHHMIWAMFRHKTEFLRGLQHDHQVLWLMISSAAEWPPWTLQYRWRWLRLCSPLDTDQARTSRSTPGSQFNFSSNHCLEQNLHEDQFCCCRHSYSPQPGHPAFQHPHRGQSVEKTGFCCHHPSHH